MIQNENVAPVSPAQSIQVGLSNVVLPTLNGKTDHDQTEIRHALLDMNKTIQAVQNNIPVASSGSLSSGAPLQPLTSTLSGNFTYSAPSTSGFYSVYIPSAYLVAASGGPYTLTIQSGSIPGSTVKVPISAFGNTIASGNLLFDIYVDSNSNVTAKDFQVSGSNSNGSYVQFADGTMEEWGTSASYTNGAGVTITLPVPFKDATYIVNQTRVRSGSTNSSTSAPPFAYVVSTSQFTLTSGGTENTPSYWTAIGRWM
jgi:hypothetical protein